MQIDDYIYLFFLKLRRRAARHFIKVEEKVRLGSLYENFWFIMYNLYSM
jgi:hypothetical protein